MDNACFYDARLGPGTYGGMFNPMTHEPLLAYYSFKAFNEVYKLGNQIKAEVDDEDVYTVAAREGKTVKAMIVNTAPTEKTLKIKLDGKITSCKLLSEEATFAEVTCPDTLPAESVLLITAELQWTES